MANYTTLVADRDTDGSIKNWINKSTIPSTTVLEEAESWIYRRLRVRDMLSVDTSNTIASGEDTLALPTGYLGIRVFMLTSPSRRMLRSTTEAEVETLRPYSSAGVVQSSVPGAFYADGSNFHFNCKADRAYTTRLVIYKQPTALSGSNLTNFLTSRYPRLLRCACLAFASEFLKNTKTMNDWLAKAQAEIDEINIENDMAAGDMQADAYVMM